MKKTFSLKLMLLGLMATVSTSALAHVGDIFTDKNLVCKELAGEKAMVLGYANAPTNGMTVTIPDQVTNGSDGNKTLFVSSLADDWFQGGYIAWVRDNVILDMGTNRPALTGYTFTLKIEASELKSLKTQQIQPLNGNITQFIVTTTAGLKGIPAYAFANVPTIWVDNTDSDEYKEQKQKIEDYENLLATQSLEDKQVCVVENGVYQGPIEKYKGFKVYNLIINSGGNLVPETDPRYVILDITAEGTPDVVEPSKTNYPLMVVQANGSVAEAGGATARKNSSGKLVRHSRATGQATVIAEPLKASDAAYECWGSYTVKGLNTLASEAETKYEELRGLCNTISSSPAYLQLLDNQIAATTLVLKLKALETLYAKVHDAWFDSSYDVTDQVAAGDPGSITGSRLTAYTNIMKAMLNAGFPNLKHPKAGKEQLKTTGGSLLYEPTHALVSMYNVPGNAIVLKKTDGSFYYATVYTTNASGSITVKNADAIKIIDKDGNAVTFDEQPAIDGVPAMLTKGSDKGVFATAMFAEGDYSLKGFAKPSFQTLHTMIYEAEDAQAAADQAVEDFVAYTDEEGNTYNKAELGGNDCMGGLVGEAYQDWQDAEQDIADYNKAKGADLNEMKRHLNEDLATKPVPESDPSKFDKNEVLTKVQIDNQMETFGEACFVNCIAVEKDNWTANGTKFLFPASTTKIDAYAFKGTHINAKLGDCATNLQKIGDYAFMGTETQYVNLTDATQLTDVDEDGNPLTGDDIMIGKGVWNDTPLVEIGLRNTALTLMPDGLAENIRRAEKDVDGCEAEGFKVQANTTLTKVVLPQGLTKIADKQFIWCVNLTTLNVIPATVTSIGAQAFRGTAIQNFDLTALTELTKVGDLAFANNSALLSVKFAPEAPFTNLEGSTFECDNNLNELVINDDLECLPAGILKGTSLKKLDLSKSQITVLNNLFQAEATGDLENTTLVELTLPETLLDKDNFTVLRPGLKVIADKALSQLKALKGTKIVAEDGTVTYRMIIPKSVELMGSYVFQNDKALENVDFIDTKLVNLGQGTFNSCDSLQEVKFISLNRIDATRKTLGSRPTIDGAETCGDPIDIDVRTNIFSFIEGVVFGSVGRKFTPKVYVTKESYNYLKGIDGISTPYYEQHYTELVPFDQTIDLVGPASINGVQTYAATYFNPYYGTWIPTKKEKQGGATVKVWTAYQDGDVIYAYGAKHNNNFYKIPAAGEAKDSYFYPTRAARMFGYSGDVDDPEGDSFVPVGSGNMSDYQMPEQEDMDKFAKQTTAGTYIFDKVQKYVPGSAVVLITSDKDQAVNFEQHSTLNTKYQSTLDWKNELKVTGIPVATTDDDNIYKFTIDEGKWTFYQDVRDPIPALKTVFPMSAYQGTAYPDLLTREIVFLDGEFTSIDDVKEYVKAMKESGAIYNMNGIRVSTPVKGQLYIQNGKKFIQK